MEKIETINFKLTNYSDLPSTQCIYFITNIINQKYYLGRAIDIKGRYSWKDIEYSHHNYHLKNSILKYGRENFIISITEYPNITLPELIEIEQGLLNTHYGNGLCINISSFASGGCEAGENHHNYGKKRYNNGVENKLFSPEEEIPEGYFLGVKEETKQKCSEVKKGKTVSEETKQKYSEAKKGENNPIYGKMWYNNGIEEKLFSPEEEIPEGYFLGGLPTSEETKRKWSIKVITSLCCYYSVKDAYEELRISKRKFYKLFEKDLNTGFYVEK